MKKAILLLLLVLPTLLWGKSYPATATLPQDLKWSTYEGDYFGDPKAIRGGVYRDFITTFPQTFRLYGPNAASGEFVGYNRSYSMWSLTGINPETHEITPNLATHWAVMPDQRTVYYKLDPDAKWSDGKPLTADDYLFAHEFMQSPHIQDVFYNQYIQDHFEAVEKVDDYTLKIVSKQASWRILHEMDISPMPAHHIKLDEKWVKDYNWKPNLTPGPYVLKEWQKGKSLSFVRQKQWWGEKKKRYQGLFNFDEINLKVVSNPDTAFEMFKKGKFDIFGVEDNNRWVRQTDFEEIKKGYIHKRLIYIDKVTGPYGIFMNLKDPVLEDRNVRRALNHLFDFQTMNEKMLFNLEARQVHFFDVFPPYRKPDAKTYPFDIQKANELLDLAGWKERNSEGIRMKNGKPLKVTITERREEHVKFLAFYKETARKAGIDIDIKLIDGSAYYNSFRERGYQTIVLKYSASMFPSPRQFLHSENVQKGTNNGLQFANARVDQLTEVYEFDLNEKKRIAAIFEIEEILHQEAAMVHFWRSDHTKLLWWRYIKGPKGFVNKMGLDLDALWIDPKERRVMMDAKKSHKSMPVEPVESDPFGLKGK